MQLGSICDTGQNEMIDNQTIQSIFNREKKSDFSMFGFHKKHQMLSKASITCHKTAQQRDRH